MTKLLHALALLPVLAAPALAQIADRVDRSWSPQSLTLKRIVVADLDDDLRDDAVFVLAGGTMQRAVNPGILSGFFPFASLTDVVDAVGVRTRNGRDLVVSVGSSSGLTIHGVHGNGSVLSVPSTSTSWTSVTRLRVIDAGRFPLLAGIQADGKTVRLASLDLATLTFHQFATVTFPSALRDLEWAGDSETPTPHLVGITASSLTRIEVDGSIRSTIANLAVTEAALVRMPGQQAVACVRRSSPLGSWQLTIEDNGSESTPVALLGFADPSLDSMKIRDIDVGHLDGDAYPDLLIGQASNGRSAVLFGNGSGSYSVALSSVLSSPDVGIDPIASDAAPPVVARVDGTLHDGVFYAYDAIATLVVYYVVPPGSGNEQHGGDLLPDVDDSSIYTVHQSSSDDFDLHITIPGPLRELLSAHGLDQIQITVLSVSGIVDEQGTYTPGNPQVEVAVRGDHIWSIPSSLPTTGGTLAMHLPIDLSEAEYQNQRKHLVLLTRFVSLDSSGAVATASFTTPMWFSKGWRDASQVLIQSQFIEGAAAEGIVFDVGDPPREVGPMTGSKNIARLRRALPLVPPMPGPPIGSSVVHHGSAGVQ